MTKKRIIITGDIVHDIGYRLFLFSEADDINLKGFNAKNIDKNKVEVEIEGDEDKILKFIEFVKKEYPSKAEISKIEIFDYEGRVRDINSFYRYFQLEQMVKFVSIGNDVRGIQEKMLDNQGTMIGNQEKMLDNQGTIINEIKELRTDLKTYLDERLKKIETEITKIKEKIGLK